MLYGRNQHIVKQFSSKEKIKDKENNKKTHKLKEYIYVGEEKLFSVYLFRFLSETRPQPTP